MIQKMIDCYFGVIKENIKEHNSNQPEMPDEF